MLVFRQQVYAVLDGDPLTAPPLARAINAFIIFGIILSVLVVIAESYQPLYEANRQFFEVFELVSVGFFTFEFLLRLWARGAAYRNDDGGNWRGRLEYLTSFHGIVDFLAIAPFYLQAFFPGADLRILRLLRLLRLLKISRYNSALEDLVRAVVAERLSFVATLYILFIALTITSGLMYYVEGPAQPEKLASIPHAMYWSLITLTTVGYGDISPITPLGKLISGVTAMLGVSTIAMLTGVVSSSFANQVARRRVIFEQEVEKAYEDGVLTEEESRLLDKLKSKYDLSDLEVESMINRATKTPPSSKSG
jgi:voltage-gated potassium channel